MSPSRPPLALMSFMSAWQYGHQSAAKKRTTGTFAASASAAARLVKAIFLPSALRHAQLASHLRIRGRGVRRHHRARAAGRSRPSSSCSGRRQPPRRRKTAAPGCVSSNSPFTTGGFTRPVDKKILMSDHESVTKRRQRIRQFSRELSAARGSPLRRAGPAARRTKKSRPFPGCSPPRASRRAAPRSAGRWPAPGPRRPVVRSRLLSAR